MARQTRYLLAYDISSPRRLRRVHGVAMTFGYPLQYSLFVCDLDAVAFVALVDALRSEIHEREDRVSLFDLGAPAGGAADRVTHLGRAREIPAVAEATMW